MMKIPCSLFAVLIATSLSSFPSLALSSTVSSTTDQIAVDNSNSANDSSAPIGELDVDHGGGHGGDHGGGHGGGGNPPPHGGGHGNPVPPPHGGGHGNPPPPHGGGGNNGGGHHGGGNPYPGHGGGWPQPGHGGWHPGHGGNPYPGHVGQHYNPYPVHGYYPWPHWNHPPFERPIYGWPWDRVRAVTCTAEDSNGNMYPVTEDAYYGVQYQNEIANIEDAAMDWCYEQTQGDTGCLLLDCTSTY